MTVEAWIAVASLVVTILTGLIIVYARLVRLETILAPIAKWFNEGGRETWEKNQLAAFRDVVQLAVLEGIRLDRIRRNNRIES